MKIKNRTQCVKNKQQGGHKYLELIKPFYHNFLRT